MKKIFLIASVIFVGIGILIAQNSTATVKPTVTVKAEPGMKKKSPQALAKNKVSEMSAVCGLQEDQMSQVIKLYTDFYTEVNTLQSQKTTLSEEKFKAKMVELKVQRNEGIKSVLTPEQRRTLLQVNYDKDSAPAERAKSAK